MSGATALDYYDGTWHVYKPGGQPLAGVAEFFRAGNLSPARAAVASASTAARCG